MASPNSDILALSPFFSALDATPPDYPGLFQFYVPNDKAYSRWLQYPSAASPARGRAAAGRGLNKAECTVSGLGEAVELASVCAWGTETLVRASQTELGASAIPVNAILGFSQDQYETRKTWNDSPLGALDWRPCPHDPDDPIDWVRIDVQPGAKQRYVPADLVFVGRREKGDTHSVAIATTSGCAAGSTLADAKRRALQELLERDAIGCWWYGGHPATALPLDLLGHEHDLMSFLRHRKRKTTLYNISTDLCGNVVVAASWSRDGRIVALGFSARDTATQAARSAVIELLQTEIGLTQRLDAGDPLANIWVDSVGADTRAFETLTHNRPACPPNAVAAAGLSPLFVDLSRPGFAIPVVRAIIPGLTCDKPRFGTKRHAARDLGMTPPLLV